MAEVRCRFCPEHLNPSADGTFLLVEGWVPVRRGGGANTIRAKSAPRGFAHRHCLERALRGGEVQPGLFDEEAPAT